LVACPSPPIEPAAEMVMVVAPVVAEVVTPFPVPLLSVSPSTADLMSRMMSTVPDSVS
jgi:hypothetical protein